jgi:hypothetical protein
LIKNIYGIYVLSFTFPWFITSHSKIFSVNSSRAYYKERTMGHIASSIRVFICIYVAFFLCCPSFAQTPTPESPLGTISSATPRFSALSYTLVSGVTYGISVSESPRGGANSQYIKFWTKSGISVSDLLASNPNRVAWSSGWEQRIRSGSYDSPVTTIIPSSPATLTPGTTYYWHIVGSNGAKSPEASFSIAGPPAQPTLSVTNNLNRTMFEISWGAIANATSYQLFRDGINIYNGTALKQDIAVGSPGVTYNFNVKACNSAGCSGGYNVPGNFPVPPLVAVIQSPAIASNTSPVPRFSVLATSLQANATYGISISEVPRTGLNNQYVDWWSVGNVTSNDLLETNLNRLAWNTSWVKRTRNGNPDGAAVIVSNTSPATLTVGKTYYWHIVATTANGGLSKSAEGRFAVLVSSSSAISSGSHSSSSITTNTRRVIFIHTDLLGSPAVETNEQGN